jgi:uncharacterized membrane protein
LKKHYKFIITATLTFIVFAIFGFFWHNNLFPAVYYSTASVIPITEQNVLPINFAMALVVYGLTYFMFKSIKQETKFYQGVLWGVYYLLSVIGAYSFFNLGLVRGWQLNTIILELVWAVVSGALAGAMVFGLYRLLMREKA